MKTTIDQDGRIQLGRELQEHLGVCPGDEVVIERRDGEVLLKPARSRSGLCYEGNVLVHRGTSESCDLLSQVRDERASAL